MKTKDFDLSQRIQKGTTVGEVVYTDSLLDIIDFLFTDLIVLLKEENRCFGIVKSYIHSIYTAYEKIHADTDEDSIETYGRILFLFKPLLKREFNRLVDKRLSPADADICIIRKILGIIDEVEDYHFKREVGTIKKIIDKLWENIRNRAKKDSLFVLASTVRNHKLTGSIGRHSLDRFTLKEEEKPKELLSGDPTRMCMESDNKILEIKM